MDRASGSGPEGRGFKSLRAHLSKSNDRSRTIGHFLWLFGRSNSEQGASLFWKGEAFRQKIY